MRNVTLDKQANLLAGIAGMLLSFNVTANDKLLHFAGSIAVTAVTYAITEDVKTSMLVGAGVGLAKELYDSRKGGTGFNSGDLAADLLGVGVGTMLMVNMDF